MNAEKLLKLKDLAKDISLLYVEDSLTIQKQVSQFLGNIFDRFYQAMDGEEGLKVYKKETPDIIITDIIMPEKNGLEMIEELKKYNPDLKVIVLTALGDDQTFFKAIDQNIISYLVKPLDVEKLIELLIENIEDIEKIHYTRAFKDLQLIKDHKSNLKFLNSYKGVPIQSTGSIKKLSDNHIVIKMQPKQCIALEYEKFTIIELPIIKKYIKAKILSSNIKEGLAILSDPMYINYKERAFPYKRLKVDNSFKVGLHYKNCTYTVHPYDTSFISLGVVLEEIDTDFQINDEVDISIGFELLEDIDKSKMITSNKFYKMFVKGKVIRMKTSANGTVIVFLIDIKKPDQSIYSKYLNMIEKQLEEELNDALQSVIG